MEDRSAAIFRSGGRSAGGSRWGDDDSNIVGVKVGGIATVSRMAVVVLAIGTDGEEPETGRGSHVLERGVIKRVARNGGEPFRRERGEGGWVFMVLSLIAGQGESGAGEYALRLGGTFPVSQNRADGNDGNNRK